MDSAGRKVILVVCGAGFATSQLAVHTIKEKLKERGFNLRNFVFHGEQLVKLKDKLGRMGDQIDLIVSANPVKQSGLLVGDIPVLRSYAFIVGTDEQINKDMDKLIEMLELKAP